MAKKERGADTVWEVDCGRGGGWREQEPWAAEHTLRGFPAEIPRP